MAEANVFETEEKGVTVLGENHLQAPEEAYLSAVYKTKGAENPEEESYSVVQSLIQHKHQDSSDESHKAGRQTATDGADQKTSVSQELELAGRDQPGCSGSVRSLCSDSSRHECPICSEPFQSQGDHRITLLNCNHALCHRCTAGIMSRAKNTSRLECPLCRQTTPFPQWEICRLQGESYSDSLYEPRPALVISPGPEVQTPPLCCFTLERQLEAPTHGSIHGCLYPSCLVGGLRVVLRLNSLCFYISALLLLFFVLPLIIRSVLFSNG